MTSHVSLQMWETKQMCTRNEEEEEEVMPFKGVGEVAVRVRRVWRSLTHRWSRIKS